MVELHAARYVGIVFCKDQGGNSRRKERRRKKKARNANGCEGRKASPDNEGWSVSCEIVYDKSYVKSFVSDNLINL